jgi:hypothetical protein
VSSACHVSTPQSELTIGGKLLQRNKKRLHEARNACILGIMLQRTKTELLSVPPTLGDFYVDC